MVAIRFIYIITMAQRHRLLFFIWYVHTRMYGEFLEFFYLIISIKTDFFCKELSEVVSGQCILYCITSCIISQFLDESSNLKAGSKKDVVHDAFDAIYIVCVIY